MTKRLFVYKNDALYLETLEEIECPTFKKYVVIPSKNFLESDEVRVTSSPRVMSIPCRFYNVILPEEEM